MASMEFTFAPFIASSEIRSLLGFLSAVIGLLAYFPYFRDIARGSTKPHAFTWLIFTIITAIAYAAQVLGGAGSGAWIMLVSALACAVITVIAFVQGNVSYSRFDWMCLLLALFGIPLWLLTKTSSYSVIVITLVDIIACLPTLRKSLHHPEQETASVWLLSSLKFIPALLALNTISISTALYPAALVIINFVVFWTVYRGQRKGQVL
jgi:hypothetical protein